MVDFVKMLSELKAWKERKKQVRCNCESERPVICRQWRKNSEEEKACNCACHKST